MMSDFNQAVCQYLKNKNYKRLKLKAVLFDMDGVLYDSMPNHAASWKKIMLKHGVTITDEDSYMNEGRTSDSTLQLFFSRINKDTTPEERKAIYSEKIAEFAKCPIVKPINGSAELLKKVVSCGLLAMLVTGSGQPSLLDRLNNDFPDIFRRNRMVTSFDVNQGKPSPEPYLRALEKENLKQFEAIVVENAPLGIQSAVAAGLFTIAVNTGPLHDSVLIKAGANYLLPSMEALLHEWDKILSYVNK